MARSMKGLSYRRALQIETLLARLPFAIEVVGRNAFDSDPFIDLGSVPVRGHMLVDTHMAEELVNGKEVEMDFSATFTALRPSEVFYSGCCLPEGIPGFEGNYVIGSSYKRSVNTIVVDFSSEVERLGFDFGRYRPESLGDRVRVTLVNRDGAEVGFSTFVTTLTTTNDTYGFAGLKSTLLFKKAKLDFLEPLQPTTSREIGEEFYLDNLRVGAQSAFVTRFTNKTSELSKLAITYEVTRAVVKQPIVLEFYKDNEKLDFSVELSESAFSSSSMLSLPDGITASSLFKKGTHTIYLKPTDSSLSQALSDENVDVLRTAFEALVPTKIPFRGFYQERAGAIGAVRPGPDSNDNVLIKGKSSLFEASISNLLSVDRFTTPSSILVVTTAGNDTIRLVGDEGKNDMFPPITVWGGDGEDTYIFEASIAGSVRIKDKSQAETDSLNFSKFVNVDPSKRGVRVDLSKSTIQQLTQDLAITFLSADAIENVIGSQKDDLILGNVLTSIANDFKGEKGNDVLVGGAGRDKLYGGDDDDLIVGDGFALSAARWNELADAVAQLDSGGRFTFGSDLIPTAGDADEIDDGDGFDIVMGGDGSDVITGRSGTIAFGDSFKVSTNPLTLNLGNLFTGFTALIDILPIELTGEGDDKIIVNGGNNLVVGGNGKDTITGGNLGLDILFGNDGQDTIDGAGGSNLIVGGDNPDDEPEKLQGGDGINFIFGDGVSFSPEVSLAFNWTVNPSNPIDLLFGISPNFTLAGTGADLITLGPGFNLVFGGNSRDTINGSSAEHGFNVIFGNDDSDTIRGGNGTNLIVGGGNSEAVTEILRGGSGTDLVFGDSIVIKPGNQFVLPSLNVSEPKKVIASLTNLFAIFELEGAGLNEISTGDGINLVLGGDGKDVITGGSSIDLLFGNDGDDAIDGSDGFNFIVGGDGDDNPLKGGKDSDIIIGDSIRIVTSLQTFDPGEAAVTTVEGYVEKLLGFYKGPSKGSKQSAFGEELIGTGDDTIELGNGLNLAFGGEGTDTVTGGDFGDVIFGGEGDDKLYGQSGTDLVIGNEGDDEILGGSDTAPNFLFGDNAALKFDTGFNVKSLLSGNLKEMTLPSFQLVLEGNGSDKITGADGFDFIVGGDGADTLAGGDGLNFVLGDDFEVGPLGDLFSFAADLVNPGKSATLKIVTAMITNLYKLLVGAAGKEGTDGTIDKDVYTGGDSVDIVLGGSGDDELYGNGDFDFLIGGHGKDKVDAGEGGKLIKGEEFLWGLLPIDNVAYGGPGDDEFIGGSGNDLMFSDLGNDVFRGGDGRDVLIGGPGYDELFGEGGDDLLYDDSGDDLVDGGDGTDFFVGMFGANLPVRNENFELIAPYSFQTITPGLVIRLSPETKIVKLSSPGGLPFSEDWKYIELTAVGAMVSHKLTSGNVSVVVQNNRFQNPLDSIDVSGDGLISPLDALLVINHLNRPTVPPTRNVDVSGDKVISPLDALLVINYLNRRSGISGEGESLEGDLGVEKMQLSGSFDDLEGSHRLHTQAARSHTTVRRTPRNVILVDLTKSDR